MLRVEINIDESERPMLCNCNFKVEFGNLKSSHISTENLFNPSKRKNYKGEVLAQVCQKVGIEVVKCDEYSSRVCNPCARNIRNLGSLYSFVQESIQGKISKSTPTKSTPVKKRLPDMPEGKSPIRKSVQVLSPVYGPFQTPCLSRAELNSLFKLDFGAAVARRLKPFKN